jgi:hypothetical protein
MATCRWGFMVCQPWCSYCLNNPCISASRTQRVVELPLLVLGFK